jgi:hypothetical protein
MRKLIHELGQGCTIFLVIFEIWRASPHVSWKHTCGGWLLKSLNVKNRIFEEDYNFKSLTLVINHQLSGAAEARRAHNPEGNGSKPFSAITFVFLHAFLFCP